MAITTSRLLAGVRRRIIVPENQNLISNADILAMADDCIKGYIIPDLESVRQDFQVTYEDTAIVANQDLYNIPYRATGRGLRDLKIFDSANNFRNLVKIPLEEAHGYSNSNGKPFGFYFEGDQIKIVPSPVSSGETLRIYYYCAISELVEESAVARVVTIASNVVTVNSTPSTMTTGTLIDFIQGKQGNRIFSKDVAIDSVTSSSITFTTAALVPSALAALDYIALAGQSPVVQIPQECYPYLETVLCRRVLQSIGDNEAYQIMEKEFQMERSNFLKLIEPRIDGEATKIINRRGLLRSKRFNRTFF